MNDKLLQAKCPTVYEGLNNSVLESITKEWLKSQGMESGANLNNINELDHIEKSYKNFLKRNRLSVRTSGGFFRITDLIPQIILSSVYNLGYFVIMGIVIFFAFTNPLPIPESLSMPIGILLGIMTGEIPRINGFWFGSSSGSKAKDEVVNKMTSKKE